MKIFVECLFGFSVTLGKVGVVGVTVLYQAT